MASNGKGHRDGVEITAIGVLYVGPLEKKYWSSSRGKEKYPYPLGYQATRWYGGHCYYMEVSEGPRGPLFGVTCEEGIACSGQTPTAPWEDILKKRHAGAKKILMRSSSSNIDGPEMFGFTSPLVQRLCRDLVVSASGIAESSGVDVDSKEKDGKVDTPVAHVANVVGAESSRKSPTKMRRVKKLLKTISQKDMDLGSDKEGKNVKKSQTGIIGKKVGDLGKRRYEIVGSQNSKRLSNGGEGNLQDVEIKFINSKEQMKSDLSIEVGTYALFGTSEDEEAPLHSTRTKRPRSYRYKKLGCPQTVDGTVEVDVKPMNIVPTSEGVPDYESIVTVNVVPTRKKRLKSERISAEQSSKSPHPIHSEQSTATDVEIVEDSVSPGPGKDPTLAIRKDGRGLSQNESSPSQTADTLDSATVNETVPNNNRVKKKKPKLAKPDKTLDSLEFDKYGTNVDLTQSEGVLSIDLMCPSVDNVASEVKPSEEIVQPESKELESSARQDGVILLLEACQLTIDKDVPIPNSDLTAKVEVDVKRKRVSSDEGSVSEITSSDGIAHIASKSQRLCKEDANVSVTLQRTSSRNSSHSYADDVQKLKQGMENELVVSDPLDTEVPSVYQSSDPEEVPLAVPLQGLNSTSPVALSILQSTSSSVPEIEYRRVQQEDIDLQQKKNMRNGYDSGSQQSESSCPFDGASLGNGDARNQSFPANIDGSVCLETPSEPSLLAISNLPKTQNAELTPVTICHFDDISSAEQPSSIPIATVAQEDTTGAPALLLNDNIDLNVDTGRHLPLSPSMPEGPDYASGNPVNKAGLGSFLHSESVQGTDDHLETDTVHGFTEKTCTEEKLYQHPGHSLVVEAVRDGRSCEGDADETVLGRIVVMNGAPRSSPGVIDNKCSMMISQSAFQKLSPLVIFSPPISGQSVVHAKRVSNGSPNVKDDAVHKVGCVDNAAVLDVVASEIGSVYSAAVPPSIVATGEVDLETPITAKVHPLYCNPVEGPGDPPVVLPSAEVVVVASTSKAVFKSNMETAATNLLGEATSGMNGEFTASEYVDVPQMVQQSTAMKMTHVEDSDVSVLDKTHHEEHVGVETSGKTVLAKRSETDLDAPSTVPLQGSSFRGSEILKLNSEAADTGSNSVVFADIISETTLRHRDVPSVPVSLPACVESICEAEDDLGQTSAAETVGLSIPVLSLVVEENMIACGMSVGEGNKTTCRMSGGEENTTTSGMSVGEEKTTICGTSVESAQVVLIQNPDVGVEVLSDLLNLPPGSVEMTVECDIRGKSGMSVEIDPAVMKDQYPETVDEVPPAFLSLQFGGFKETIEGDTQAGAVSMEINPVVVKKDEISKIRPEVTPAFLELHLDGVRLEIESNKLSTRGVSVDIAPIIYVNEENLDSGPEFPDLPILPPCDKDTTKGDTTKIGGLSPEIIHTLYMKEHNADTDSEVSVLQDFPSASDKVTVEDCMKPTGRVFLDIAKVLYTKEQNSETEANVPPSQVVPSAHVDKMIENDVSLTGGMIVKIVDIPPVKEQNLDTIVSFGSIMDDGVVTVLSSCDDVDLLTDTLPDESNTVPAEPDRDVIDEVTGPNSRSSTRKWNIDPAVGSDEVHGQVIGLSNSHPVVFADSAEEASRKGATDSSKPVQGAKDIPLRHPGLDDILSGADVIEVNSSRFVTSEKDFQLVDKRKVSAQVTAARETEADTEVSFGNIDENGVVTVMSDWDQVNLLTDTLPAEELVMQTWQNGDKEGRYSDLADTGQVEKEVVPRADLIVCNEYSPSVLLQPGMTAATSLELLQSQDRKPHNLPVRQLQCSDGHGEMVESSSVKECLVSNGKAREIGELQNLDMKGLRVTETVPKESSLRVTFSSHALNESVLHSIGEILPRNQDEPVMSTNELFDEVEVVKSMDGSILSSTGSQMVEASANIPAVPVGGSEQERKSSSGEQFLKVISGCELVLSNVGTSSGDDQLSCRDQEDGPKGTEFEEDIDLDPSTLGLEEYASIIRAGLENLSSFEHSFGFEEHEPIPDSEIDCSQEVLVLETVDEMTSEDDINFLSSQEQVEKEDSGSMSGELLKSMSTPLLPSAVPLSSNGVGDQNGLAHNKKGNHDRFVQQLASHSDGNLISGVRKHRDVAQGVSCHKMHSCSSGLAGTDVMGGELRQERIAEIDPSQPTGSSSTKGLASTVALDSGRIGEDLLVFENALSSSQEGDLVGIISHEENATDARQDLSKAQKDSGVKVNGSGSVEDNTSSSFSIPELRDLAFDSCVPGDECKKWKDSLDYEGLMPKVQHLGVSKRMESVICIDHGMPVSAIVLNVRGEEVHLCVVCGAAEDEGRRIFVYKVLRGGDNKIGPQLLSSATCSFEKSRPAALKAKIPMDEAALHFSPDGKHLLLLDRYKLLGECYGDSNNHNGYGVNILSFESKILRVSGHLLSDGILQCLTVPSPQLLIAGGDDGCINCWELDSTWRNCKAKFSLPKASCNGVPLTSVVRLSAMSGSPHIIVGCDYGGSFALWDTISRTVLSSWRLHDHYVVKGSLMETAANSLENHEVLGKCQYCVHPLANASNVPSLLTMISRGGETSRDNESDVNSWQEDEKEYRPWNCRRLVLKTDEISYGPAFRVRTSALASFGLYGVLGTPAGYVHLWEVSTGKEICELRELKGSSVVVLASNPSAAALAAANETGRVILYYAKDGLA